MRLPAGSLPVDGDEWICGWRPRSSEVLSGTDDELLHVGRIVPIYHETKGWTSSPDADPLAIAS